MVNVVAVTESADYQWIYDDALDIDTCVTAVPGGRAEAVLKAFGADLSTVVTPAMRNEAHGFMIAATEVPGGVVAVEPGGFQGTVDRVLLRVADGGTAASVYWNANDDCAFVLVGDDKVISHIEIWDAVEAEDSETLAELGIPGECHDLCLRESTDGREPYAFGLALVAMTTGVDIARDAVAEPAVLHPLGSPEQ